MINLIKELPQNTTVIQSEHTEQCSKSSNDSAILRQSISVVLNATLFFLMKNCNIKMVDFPESPKSKGVGFRTI